MVDRKKSFIFKWKIENFSMLPHRKGEALKSPMFTVGTAKTQCCIHLYPRGYPRNDTEDYVACFLYRQRIIANSEAVNINFTLALDVTKDSFKSYAYFSGTLVDDISKGSTNFILRKNAFEKKHLLLPQDVLTVYCFILPETNSTQTALDDDQPPVSNAFQNLYAAVTRTNVQRRSFTWSIPEINQLGKSRKEISIISESILDGTPSLQLSAFFSDYLNNEYIQIEIRQTSSIERLVVKCKITVLSADKEYQDSYEATHLFGTLVTELWRFPQFLKVNNLVEKKYVADNTLFLHFELAFTRPGTENHLEIPNSLCSLPYLQIKPATEFSHLSDSIRQLYVSQKFCDVTLRVGERSFPCHKVVLCAQSSVFSAMFENDMLEKNTGLVDIEDTDPKVVERMLTFMHTDAMEDNLSTEDTLNLYVVADKYQILPLKLKCSRLILASLSIRSVCDVLAIADRHQDNFLLVNVYNFLSMNASDTFHSPQWKIFMDSYPKLSGEIMLQMWMKMPH